MPSTYSTRLRLELVATGEQSGTWGTTTNTNIGTLIEKAIAGVAAVSMSSDADYTLTALNGIDDEARCAVLSVTSAVSLTTTRNVIVPTASKTYIVKNGTTGGQSITVKTAAGTGITIPNGKTGMVFCDGTNVVSSADWFSALALTTALPVTSGGTGVTTSTGTGSVVLSTSPTLTTASLGSSTATTQAHGDNSTKVATTAYVDGYFPSGTALIFNQTSAPTGWTKSTTHNDKALRVVSGTVGSGGATAFTSVFGAGKATGAHTLTLAEVPAHSHTLTGQLTLVGGGSGVIGGSGRALQDPGTTDTQGGGGAHSHTLSLDLQYVDVIIATKD